MGDPTFSVQSWLDSNPPASCDPTHISQPVQVGSGWTRPGPDGYSYEDASGLPSYCPPALPLDLNVGREAYVPKPADDGGARVETLLSAAAASGSGLSEYDIVTFRNNLNKIFGTPFEPAVGWVVDACLLGSTLFLEIVSLSEGGKAWFGDPEEEQKFTFWGYSLEAACTGQPGRADAASMYCALLRCRVGSHRLLLGAEVDAYDPELCCGDAAARNGGPSGSGGGGGGSGGGERLKPLASFIEVKTYRLPSTDAHRWKLRKYKHPKWWLQSFLAGVPTLVLGGRDDQGIVRSVGRVRTADLHRLSEEVRARWSPWHALGFGDACLIWMRQHAAAAAPGQHVRFAYDGARRAVVAEVLPDGDLPARLGAALGAGRQT